MNLWVPEFPNFETAWHDSWRKFGLSKLQVFGLFSLQAFAATEPQDSMSQQAFPSFKPALTSITTLKPFQALKKGSSKIKARVVLIWTKSVPGPMSLHLSLSQLYKRLKRVQPKQAKHFLFSIYWTFNFFLLGFLQQTNTLEYFRSEQTTKKLLWKKFFFRGSLKKLINRIMMAASMRVIFVGIQLTSGAPYSGCTLKNKNKMLGGFHIKSKTGY